MARAGWRRARPVRRAVVRFAGRRVRTDRRGRAVMVRRMRVARRYRVVAARRGFARGVVRVRVLRARGAR